MATTKRSSAFDKAYEKYYGENSALIEDVRELSSQEKEDDTRHEVTRKFVKYYFWILIILMVTTPAYNIISFWLFQKNDLLIPFKDAILTYSAVVGPTFGLVVAYYFKTSRE